MIKLLTNIAFNFITAIRKAQKKPWLLYSNQGFYFTSRIYALILEDKSVTIAIDHNWTRPVNMTT